MKFTDKLKEAINCHVFDEKPKWCIVPCQWDECICSHTDLTDKDKKMAAWRSCSDGDGCGHEVEKDNDVYR